MGAFFTNCHVRTKDSSKCAKVLAALVGARALVTDPKNGWVSVYDERCESQDISVLDGLAKSLSAKLQTIVIAMLLHDSDVFQYLAYENGGFVDKFDSKPDYFGAVSEAQKREWHGNFGKLLTYARKGTKLADFKRVAEKDLVFEEERVGEFSKLLGIDPARARMGFKYAQETQHNFKLIYGKGFSQGQAQLVEAVSRGDAGRVRALLEKGTSPNQVDRFGAPLLVDASRHGRLKIVQDLVSHGADLFAETRGGGDALWIASAEGRQEVVTYLLGKAKGQPKLAISLRVALGAAVMGGHADVIGLLVAAGANVNEKAPQGQHALLLACMRGYELIWESRTGRSYPIEQKKDWKKVLTILLDAGAQIPFPTQQGPIDVKTLSAEQKNKLADKLLEIGSKIEFPRGVKC
jgi:hypothetical protein